MSEHLGITGECGFFHLPYEQEGSFSYCHRCNTSLIKLTIELHQGWFSDWIKAICPKCKKTIWIAELKNSYIEKPKNKEEEEDKLPYRWKLLGEEGRVLVRDNTKCSICKKPTNSQDCLSYSSGKKGRIIAVCSKKCEKIRDKINIQKMKGGKKHGRKRISKHHS